jgi:hypothetical protein
MKGARGGGGGGGLGPPVPPPAAAGRRLLLPRAVRGVCRVPLLPSALLLAVLPRVPWLLLRSVDHVLVPRAVLGVPHLGVRPRGVETGRVAGPSCSSAPGQMRCICSSAAVAAAVLAAELFRMRPARLRSLDLMTSRAACCCSTSSCLPRCCASSSSAATFFADGRSRSTAQQRHLSSPCPSWAARCGMLVTPGLLSADTVP